MSRKGNRYKPALACKERLLPFCPIVFLLSLLHTLCGSPSLLYDPKDLSFCHHAPLQQHELSRPHSRSSPQPRCFLSRFREIHLQRGRPAGELILLLQAGLRGPLRQVRTMYDRPFVRCVILRQTKARTDQKRDSLCVRRERRVLQRSLQQATWKACFLRLG